MDVKTSAEDRFHTPAASLQTQNQPVWHIHWHQAASFQVSGLCIWCCDCVGSQMLPPHMPCRSVWWSHQSDPYPWGWSTVPLQGTTPWACIDICDPWKSWTTWQWIHSLPHPLSPSQTWYAVAAASPQSATHNGEALLCVTYHLGWKFPDCGDVKRFS